MKKIKVYFYQRKTHRKRQRETVDHCPAEIEILKPDDINYINDTILSNRNTDKKLKFKSILAKIVPLNARVIRDIKVKLADYVYTWGCIPLALNKPYLIEMDNPYVICYYNLFWFKLLKPFLKHLLKTKKVKHIICISDACRKSIESEFGSELSYKIKVIYPYIPKQMNLPTNKGNKTVEFLFVSTQFLLKGGREVVYAFQAVAKKGYNFHLTMVTNLDEEQQKIYRSSNITFVQANLEKELLQKKFFSKADVFILPSYQDSFGMVYLEALSFGLPIIATRIFATPEMVYENENGFLIDPPVQFYLKNFQLNPKYINNSIVDEIKSVGLYEETVHQLENHIIKMMDDTLRHHMSIRSLEIFNEKFSPEIRNKCFLDLFMEKIRRQ